MTDPLSLAALGSSPSGGARGPRVRFEDLDEPDEPARVLRVDGRGGAGGKGLRARDERLRAFAREERLELRAAAGIGLPRVDAAQERGDVEPGAAGDDQVAAGLRGLARGFARRFEPAAGAEGLVGVREVDAAQDDARALGGGRLGGADVHAAVDEHRVGGEDERAGFPRDRVGDRGLPRRRAADEEERRAAGCGGRGRVHVRASSRTGRARPTPPRRPSRASRGSASP